MGIYIYVVYEPTEPPSFVGAWDALEAAAAWTEGNHVKGMVPHSESDKRYRIVQLVLSRKNQCREDGARGIWWCKRCHAEYKTEGAYHDCPRCLPLKRLQQRADGIREWLRDNAPYVSADQRHLEEHTPERAYWHYGYQAAITDTIKLLSNTAST